jgi:hypothetical protein
MDHRGLEGLHLLRLQLVVLLGKLRGRTCSLLHPVRCGVPLLPGYDALLEILIVLTKSLLTLMADGFELRLELPRGPQQLVALILHLLGLLLVLTSVLNEG